jgi:hypothetical protein
MQETSSCLASDKSITQNNQASSDQPEKYTPPENHPEITDLDSLKRVDPRYRIWAENSAPRWLLGEGQGENRYNY